MREAESLADALAKAIAAGELLRPKAWRGSGVACALDDVRKREEAALIVVPVGPAGRGLCPRFLVAEYCGTWELLTFRELTDERAKIHPMSEREHA